MQMVFISVTVLQAFIMLVNTVYFSVTKVLQYVYICIFRRGREEFLTLFSPMENAVHP
jgi:hypothetical protein